jgi:hypothetical protein
VHGLVGRHVEGVAKLVRHDDRAHVLDVAQLDDLVIDRQARDRVGIMPKE